MIGSSNWHDVNITVLAEFFSESVTKRSEWVLYVYSVVMFFVFVCGVIGNALICIVIYCDKTMHTATNYYLFNLAASDLAVSFGILIDIGGLNTHHKIFILNDLICKVHSFLILSLWNNGILTLTVLAVERYVAIWHPLYLNGKPKWRRVMPVIALIWVLAIIEAVPETWTIAVLTMRDIEVCMIIPSTFTRFLNGILGLTTFLIPLGTMVFVYVMIAFKLKKTQDHNIRKHIFNYRDNTRKVNKLIVFLTLSFLVCWLPYFWMRVIIFTQNVPYGSPWYNKNWDILLLVASFHSWFSSVLNPLLCNLMSTKFRNALKKLWARKLRSPRNGMK